MEIKVHLLSVAYDRFCVMGIREIIEEIFFLCLYILSAPIQIAIMIKYAFFFKKATRGMPDSN